MHQSIICALLCRLCVFFCCVFALADTLIYKKRGLIDSLATPFISSHFAERWQGYCKLKLLDSINQQLSTSPILSILFENVLYILTPPNNRNRSERLHPKRWQTMLLPSMWSNFAPKKPQTARKKRKINPTHGGKTMPKNLITYLCAVFSSAFAPISSRGKKCSFFSHSCCPLGDQPCQISKRVGNPQKLSRCHWCGTCWNGIEIETKKKKGS